MIITTTRIKASHRGFTLAEVMIATALGSMVLAGVLSTFLMLGRSGANVANYSTMETQTRRALEEFSQDVRMSSDAEWNGTTSISLKVTDNYTTTSNWVTYAYDSAAETFYRMPGKATAGNLHTTLVSNVDSFSYSRYDRLNNATTTNASTKRVQLTMVVRTTTNTVAGASNNVLSASFILRNKLAN